MQVNQIFIKFLWTFLKLKSVLTHFLQFQLYMAVKHHCVHAINTLLGQLNKKNEKL